MAAGGVTTAVVDVLSRWRTTVMASTRGKIKPAVVLVGAPFSQPWHYWPMSYYLSNYGDFVVNEFQYDPVTYSLQDNARILAQVLARYKRHTEIEHPVHFVTHSYGALILRQSMKFCEWNDTPSRVVMLAPCNRGSMLARKLSRYGCGEWFLGPQAAAMLGTHKGTYFDKHLGPLPPKMPTLVVAGTSGMNPMIPSTKEHDGRVTVKETRLPGPHRRLKVDSSHVGMLFSPRVMEDTLKFLTRKPVEDAELIDPAATLQGRGGDKGSVSMDAQGEPAAPEPLKVGASSIWCVPPPAAEQDVPGLQPPPTTDQASQDR